MGNEFSNDLKTGGYVFKTLGEAAAGLGSGVVSTIGGKPDFSGLTSNLHNIGTAYNGDNQALNDIYNPPSKSELQQRSINVINSNEKTNLSNALTVGHVVSNAYSGAMKGVTPPSQLMSISNPSAKMMIASSRGGARQSLQTLGHSMDMGAASTLQSTVNQAPQLGSGATGSLGVGK